MKVSFLYDQGSARFPEDALIFQSPRFFGVLDGVSGIYLPDEGPQILDDGRTGGQFVSWIVAQHFDLLSGKIEKTMSLEDILAGAINTLAISLGKFEAVELLPGATFAVAEITDDTICIIQGGDSMAVWLMKDGTVGGTPNQAFAYEEELLYEVAILMKKHGGDRQKMWQEFRPFLVQKRREHTNKSFALLNGQSGTEDLWQKFVLPRQEIELLILFTDGFVPFEWTRDAILLAKRMMILYRSGQNGLQSILKTTRSIAAQNKSSSHEDYAEATAIAIEF